MNKRTGLICLCIAMSSSGGWAQYLNYRVSTPGESTPEEVTIAINPTNPRNLAAGANIDFHYYSLDGGRSWKQGTLTSTLGVWGDPCVAFDADGNLFFGHLSNPDKDGYWIDRIVVQKSTDGGVAWDDGVGVGFVYPRNQDKEWIVADITDSPFRNHLYMTWTEFDRYGSTEEGDSSRILFARSEDAGESWLDPVRISDRGGNCLDNDSTVEGAVPAVGPAGEVYVSWSASGAIYFDMSLDGGKTFGKDIIVTDQPGGWAFSIPGIYRTNGFPVTVCDISHSPYRGTIYILWSDQRNGEDNTDVFLMKSTDKGATWSKVIRVNNDLSKRHQFFPWVTVDPKTGILYAVFYDRRETTGNATDVYVARSEDGGETFLNFKISNASFTPNPYIFFGDYINIAAWDGSVHPIWMRMDDSNLSVWTAILNDKTPLDNQEFMPETIRLEQNYPNPFNSITTIRYVIGSGHIENRPDSTPLFVELTITNVFGQKIQTLISESQPGGQYIVRWDASGFPSGIYYVRLTTKNQELAAKSQALKMILIK